MSVSRRGKAPRGFVVGRLLDEFDKEIALNPTAFAIVSSGTSPSIDLYRSN